MTAPPSTPWTPEMPLRANASDNDIELRWATLWSPSHDDSRAVVQVARELAAADRAARPVPDMNAAIADAAERMRRSNHAPDADWETLATIATGAFFDAGLFAAARPVGAWREREDVRQARRAFWASRPEEKDACLDALCDAVERACSPIPEKGEKP